MNLSRKIFSLLICVSMIGGSFPLVAVASPAPPEITNIYQKDGHVKVEWATQMADSDVLYLTSFEPGQEIPRLTWGGNNIYGNQSVLSQPSGYNGGNLLRLTDTISNMSGNWVNYPQTENDTSIFTFSGRSYPNLAVISVNAKVRAVAGTDNMARFLISTGWFKKGFPRTDNNGRTIKFGETVDFNHPPAEFSAYVDGGDISIDDKTTFVIVSSHDQNYNYGVIYYDWDAKSKKFIKGPTDVWTQVSPTGIVPTLNKDIFYAGEPILNYREAGTYFPERRLDSSGQWKTISMNAEIGNYGDDYDMEKNGIRAYGIWKTDGELQMDDIKIGYATESEVFRDGQSVYRGYLSDFEDTAAVDKAAPSAPSGGGITIDANRKPVISWNPALDNGTTYQYQIKGYPRNDPATALSAPKSVTVTSGVKGYAVVLDQNPNTVPPATVTTTSTTFTGPNPVTGNFYAHIATIDNQGNVSAVEHLQFADNIKPTLQITSSNTAWTSGPITLQAVARDDQTGIKRIQRPDGTWVNSDHAQFDVSQNGTYTFTAEDNAGNQQSEIITVNNIDREQPTISITPNSRPWGSDRISVRIQYEDLLSGLDPNQRLYKITKSPDEPVSWDTASGDIQDVEISTEGTWYVHAKAADRVGNTAVSATNALQLQKQPETPQLKLIAADESSAKLEWSLPNGLTLTDGYHYILQNVTTGQSWDLPYPTSQFTDTGLKGGGRYSYQVKAVNRVGESSFSNSVEALTLPEAPEDLKIEKDGRDSSRALASFKPVDSATGYRIVAVDMATQQEVFNQTVTGAVYQPINNLQPGTFYDIAVSAFNSTGEGKAIHGGYLSLPDAPGGFNAVQIGEDRIDLNWNTVQSATYYILERELQEIYGGPDNVFSDIQLLPGTPNNYRVSAANQTGFGEYSELNNIWTLPAAVSVFEAVYAGTDQITLHWSDVTGADGYVLTVENQNAIQLPQGTTEYTFDALVPGETYEFGIRPVNRSGSGKIKTLQISTVPAAPDTVETKDIEEQSAKITFPTVPGASKYRISINGKQYDIADTELQVTGLTGGTSYDFTIAAGNASGFGQTVSGKLLTLPAAPNNLQVKNHSPESVTFAWDPVRSAEKYIVYDENNRRLGEATETHFTVSGLKPSKDYFFFVKAKNASGTGAGSVFTWLTLPNAEQGKVNVKNIRTNAADLTWTEIPGTDGYRIYDEKHQLVQTTAEPKVSIEQLQSAAEYKGWNITGYNRTGETEPIPVPTFETLPSGDFEIKATAEKQKELKLTIESQLKNETYVIESQGKELYRGKDLEYTVKGLAPDAVYTFKAWTENSKGDKSAVKSVQGKTLKAEVVPTTPGTGGGSYTPPNPPATKPEDKADQPQSQPQPEPEKTQDPFSDLNQAFNPDQIRKLYELGILQGNAGKFEPKRSITRIEFMSLIVRALQLQGGEDAKLTFTDIDPQAWYIPELKAALKHGVAKGFSAKEFRPNALITREQASKMLGNVLFGDLRPEGEVSFSDSKEISFWAKDEVVGLAVQKLLTGYPDNTFRPQNKLTRAESAALIYRILFEK